MDDPVEPGAALHVDELTDLQIADPVRLHLHGDEGGVVVAAREGEVFDVDALVGREVGHAGEKIKQIRIKIVKKRKKVSKAEWFFPNIKFAARAKVVRFHINFNEIPDIGADPDPDPHCAITLKVVF